MLKKIKVFEALIGTAFQSWKSSSDCSITATAKVVTMTNKVKSENFTGVLTTKFDLSKLIAYSIGT